MYTRKKIFTASLWIVEQLQRDDWDTASGYSHAVQTMMLMVLKQASGRPWGDHGLFLRYHIEAASIRGINSFRQYKTDATTIGRSVQVYVHGQITAAHYHVFAYPHKYVVNSCFPFSDCWRECFAS